MEDSKESDTPIATTTKLDIDEPGSSVDHKMYRGMIGSLLYFTTSRPDIVFSVSLCARFQENLNESHLAVFKRILRYLKGTTDICLWYLKGSNFNLVGYVDINYAGFLVDRKSISCMAHFLGSCLVSWTTKKHTFVALSTTKVEYVAAASCCAQLLWIKQ
ncbi:secreted RxLR effector protein 161-like [Nicotiana tomentosiformis]|uniref:secreted RxLR effector protein 161-like n=1 Tax=Nicotiana tomentosiformis TaxID=4098 RepID=UPI00388CD914